MTDVVLKVLNIVFEHQNYAGMSGRFSLGFRGTLRISLCWAHGEATRHCLRPDAALGQVVPLETDETTKQAKPDEPGLSGEPRQCTIVHIKLDTNISRPQRDIRRTSIIYPFRNTPRSRNLGIPLGLLKHTRQNGHGLLKVDWLQKSNLDPRRRLYKCLLKCPCTLDMVKIG